MRQKTKSRSTLRWLSVVAGKAKKYIVALLIIQTLLGISGVYYALLLRELVNAAVAKDESGFRKAVASFVVLVLLQIALRAMHRFFEEFSKSTMENCFKSRLFCALLRKDYASVTRVNSGEWMNRLTSDTQVVAEGMAQILPGVAGMAVKMAGALAAILLLEPRFLYILVPGGMLMFFFTYSFRRILKTLHKKIQEADGRLRVFFQERLGAMLIVRTFAQESQTEKQAEQWMYEHRRARMQRNHFSNACNVGFGAAMNGAYVLGAIFCGYGILTGTMSYGNLMAILQLISQIQNPFANITGYLPKYYAMLASAERLMEAEDYPEDCPGEAISRQQREQFYREDFEGLEISGASFTYQPPVSGQGEPESMPVVFSNISLTIRKGQYVAFTGPSGCGKSTILKLLMRLYPLDAGTCSLLTRNGRMPLTSQWRGLFAYVPQGNQLLSGTIREIIAFGDPENMRRDEELKRALTIACAQEFVEGLKQGIDTLLGERGTGLSEGQMQRIAIARAVFSDHPILLLDEATSSLDEEVEAKLLANLRRMTDKTVVIVTHRTAVLSICDVDINFGKLTRNTLMERKLER